MLNSNLKKELLLAFPSVDSTKLVDTVSANMVKKLTKLEREFARGEYHNGNSTHKMETVILGDVLDMATLRELPTNAQIEQIDGMFCYKTCTYVKNIPLLEELVNRKIAAFVNLKNNLTNAAQLPDYSPADCLVFNVPDKIVSLIGRTTVYGKEHLLVRLRESFQNYYGCDYNGLLNHIYNIEKTKHDAAISEFERGIYTTANSIEKTVKIEIDNFTVGRLKGQLSKYAKLGAVIKFCNVDVDDSPYIVFEEYIKRVECPVYMTTVRIINLISSESARLYNLKKLENEIVNLSK